VALRAGIDIGTNTILLLVADVTGGDINALEDHVTVVRLGQGVDQNRAFHPEAIARARACFSNYAEILKKYPGVDVRAVATSGSRDAKNSDEFFASVEKDYGIKVKVISGEEEAILSFRGALPEGAADPTSIAVLDIGGGSSEVVGLEAGSKDRLFRHSFDMGCVRLSERFLKHDPALASEIQELEAFVEKDLSTKGEILQALRGKTLIAVAGTATYLAATHLSLSKFDVEKVNGTKMTLEDIDALITKLAPLSAAQRLGMGGMDKGRADVILAGAYILRAVLKKAGLDSVQVSVRGLRYGAVL
jgi:exopolyphosphatase/guanosine-5'-triphosphate,3'-diphosphate pyrophosphatase